MPTHIALLRGINVSGQKLIRMKELSAILSNLGYQHVQTYIQSGNIVFQSETSDEVQLADQISRQIDKVFGFEVTVFVRSVSYLETIIGKSPFKNRDDFELKKCYYVFLSKEPEAHLIQELQEKNYENERFNIENQCLYLYCIKGAGEAKLTNNEIQKRLGVKATSRNHNTVQKLVAMGKAQLEL